MTNYPKFDKQQMLSKAAFHLAGIGLAVGTLVMLVQILELLLTFGVIGAAMAFFGYLLAKTVKI